MKAILVVIPMYYTEQTLQLCLEAVVRSTAREQVQIVVVDDGGNTNIQQLLAPYAVKLVSTGEMHSAAYARNLGARQDKSEVLVFIDADVVIEPEAIERLTRPILSGQAEATVGNYSKKPEGLNFAQYYKQLYISHVYSRRKGYIRNEFWTALGAVKTSVYHSLGGFNTTFQGATGEDVDFGIRMTRTSYRILQVPDAMGQHFHAFTMIKLARNDFIKGLNLVQNIFRGDVDFRGNRHTSVRDICAVLCASLLGMIMLGQFLVSLSLIVLGILSICLLISYLEARGDLLRTFRQAGVGFLLKSMPTMYVLDCVRGLCVPMGVLLVWLYGKNHTTVLSSADTSRQYYRHE